MNRLACEIEFRPAWQKMAVWAGGLVVLTLLLVCLSWTRHSENTPQAIVPDLKAPSGYSLVIGGGIKITDHRAGCKTFCLNVDTLAIEKKKLGFLRLGFMRVACLKGVSLDLYDHSDSDTFSAASLFDTGPLFLQRKKFKQYLPGPVNGIEMSQVTINLFKKSKLLSKISADQALINAKNRQILFKGHVQIATCDGKRLSGNRFAWHPDTGKVVTSRAWVLKTDQQKIKGKGLETTIELKNGI